MKKKCQVFTPEDYVDQLLNSLNYDDSPYGKKILENSCGDGNILSQIVIRYINYCKSINLSPMKISEGLTNDIYGVEIDEIQYQICINRLNEILDDEKIPSVTWNIVNADYFSWIPKCDFSYIVGNPPYITYSEIPANERMSLKSNFISCSKGKFDYCYAFIEKSLSELSNDGKMSYLIPSSIFKTVFGNNLRNLMLPYVTSIFDYSSENIFSDALVKSSVLNLDKATKNKSLLYKYEDKAINITKEKLNNKWIFFEQNNDKKNRFGDYFQVSHSVATLCNKAFLLENYIETDNYYELEDLKIEKEIVRPAVSAKTYRYNKQKLIIFPYFYKCGKLEKYTSEDFLMKFPETVNYLQTFRKELDKRNSDNSAKWFEYGRSQALSNINQPKLIISVVISDKMLVYETDANSVPYAGMYIVSKGQLPLEKAKEILESEEFLKYALSIGVHMSGNSVRIMSKDIMEFRF